MIAQSQSGTGKTAAFVLAMLSRTNASKNYPHIICLSPTYELAIQTGEVLKQMATFMPDIKVRFAVRGEESITIFNCSFSFLTSAEVFYFISQSNAVLS
jgi:ATP-dependent RNA helicase DDX19/DBP5